MNQMNVTGMNPGVGGPVGGVPMMNNGSTAPRNDGNVNNIPETMINNLNTYIYDYFLKRGYHECARALVKDESIKLNTEPPTKTSPGHRREDMNGVEGDAMMTDSKDGDKIKIPDDLPRPNLASESQQSSFLLDWFSLFWDFFWAQRKKGNSNDVRQYLQHTQNMMRLREQQHNQLLRQQPVMPGQMGPLNMRRNGMVPANLQKTVLQNNTGGLSQQQIAQLQKNQQMHMMQQMQREHSDMDMNGHRPQSPSSAENAPSPSKRPRLENGPMNGQQLAPNGRGQGQGMPGQPNSQALLMQNGLNPRAMNPAQFAGFQQPGPAAQQKSIQVYAQNLALHHSRSALNNQGIPNGLMNPGVMPNQTDLVPMPDGQGMYPMNGDYYGANGQMAQVRAGMQTPGGQHGNHALQDYQMQLMLLEQQNKRRLMMARQEQDSMSRTDGQPPMPGQQGLPPGTSPQGSRAGTSPNPNDQMKRGTPKMPQTGLPGSPSAADAMAQNRGSPAAMNFNGGQMPPDMAGGQFFMKGMPDAMAGPNGMRPPSSNPAFTGPQMGQPIQAGAVNRVPSGNWQQQQGQPMAPQHSPAQQPQSTGTPQTQNSMPPPQAPPAGVNTGRASPQTQNAAPPTPQQTSKPAPKKKEPKDTARKRTTKKQPAAAAAAANTAATPSSEAEHPPTTPTPSTPITPQHPSSFNKAGPNPTTGAPQQPTSAPAPQPIVQQPPPDQTQQSFNDLSIPDASAFNLDFSALENPDILENFDFDTFLNTDADTAGFGFDPNISYPTDGVETGAGDGL
ncbi:adhesion defective protein 2 [Aspergillus udagawae]|uniref:Adhesion defective protein 2 n=1 Tax=Aspergillus udagawae TaxID=91492 RepID=A0A8E0V370_9EURO|nr:uncharacterized protein Aud_009780 [Aspergillus udagawae]GFF95487.1 adhesion defective protein 2 [Aspergillus udagawae]GIC93298.1 hypothetical protein Aud_009780 [Aspergillus udagawae]